MHILNKRFSLVLVFVSVLILASLPSAYAQSSSSVSLKLVDEKTQEAISYATISLTKKSETSPKYYMLSDAAGTANFAKVAKGSYVLKAEIMGYLTHTQEITVEKSLNLGTIKMKEDAKVLDAASVSAVGNPIVVKKDTVEYNASSFKTSENDVLEDLLKKLPGIEVGEDGTITANGETIKKITIDGKTFFLDDPSLASKNIPAKIINKVKVVDKKSDQALFTGIDDGNEETIIDLSIRPGMMNGWFGNVMLGGGHDVPSATNTMNDWRYQGAAMVGRFTDKSQISLILNGNNTNNRAFNDMAGSMMGNMRGGGGGMGRGRGGWGESNGITNSWMGGLNGAFTLCDGNMDLAGNYLFNGAEKYVTEESLKDTYLDDGSILRNENKGVSINNTYGHRFGIRLDHKFSENTSILFEPQFNFGKGNYSDISDFNTSSILDGVSTETNKGWTKDFGDNKNWTASGFLLFRQKLGKAGRTFSIMTRYSFSGNNLDGFNQSITSSSATPEIVDQRVDRTSNSSSINARAVYTEPLAKNFFLEANYSFGWNQSNSIKNVFSALDVVPTLVDGNLAWEMNGYSSTRDEIYSNDILNRYINQSFGVNFAYQKEKFRAQLGFSGNPTNTHNETNGESYDSKVIKWSPQVMLYYEPNDNTSMRMFYWGSSNQPTTSQLMPVPDNSNPLNISLGNPNLRPYFNHSIRGMYRYTNKKNFLSINAHIRGGIVQDAITNASWYDNKGVQYSIPVNSKGSGNFNGNIFVNAPIKKSNFSVFSMTNISYSQSASFVGTTDFSQNVAANYYDPVNAVFKYEEFNRDYPSLYDSEHFSRNLMQSLSFAERIRFTYRNDFVELNLGGRTRMSKSWFTLSSSQANLTWNNQAQTSMNWTLPWGMNLITELNYNWYNGYSTPQEDEFIWNAEITQLLFKKKFTLAIKAYDILNQSKNLSITDAANYHQEIVNNTLGRYIVLSLTYRFGKFNGDKMRGGRGMGPGGPGGGPGGPGGPMRR